VKGVRVKPDTSIESRGFISLIPDRKYGGSKMSRAIRWQDAINAILGVILFITPFVFTDMSQTPAVLTGYVGGALLFVLGAGSLLFRWDTRIAVLPLVEGVLLFLAPWVLGFSGNTGMAWSAWVIGVLAFISSGSALIMGGNMMRRSTATH
jgi:VIT1/CCC1 family predicted Fe2+/Mn2+ transporter